MLIERHVFMASEPAEKYEGYEMLRSCLTRVDDDVDLSPETSAKFVDWINRNHVYNLPSGASAPHAMARCQMLAPSRLDRELRGIWKADEICTDMICFGSLKDAAEFGSGVGGIIDPPKGADIPPRLIRPKRYDVLGVDWHFGLQSVNLGRLAEGRAVKMLDERLLRKSLRFLGFEYESIGQFIRLLQAGAKATPSIDNPLGLSESIFTVEEQPWAKLWVDGNSLSEDET